MLRSKHPDLRDPLTLGTATSAFEPYPTLPTAVPVDITADIVEMVAARL